VSGDTICVSVDVEDWVQSTFDIESDISDRVRVNTLQMLDLVDELSIVATWFVQGMVAEAFPELVGEILSRGHEVGCHAHTHRPLWKMGAKELREDIQTARKTIEDAGGRALSGFRAPDFSVCPPTRSLDQVDRSVFQELAEQGFEYDSSVVPARTRRYGISSAPRGPFMLREGLIEIPTGSVRLGRMFPALGGGYLRVFPQAYQRLSIAQSKAGQYPPVVYLHPYELDPRELSELNQTRSIPLKTRVLQGLGRGRVRERLTQVTRGLRSVTMQALCAGLRREDLVTV